MLRPKTPFHPAMVDPPRELALTVSRSALERQQRGARVSISIDSSPQVPAHLSHGTPCPVLSFPYGLSPTRPPGSHRRLPIPPVHDSRSPSASTSPTSPSSPSPPTQLIVIPSAVPTAHFQNGQNPPQSFLSLGNVVQVLTNGRHQWLQQPPLFHNAQLILRRSTVEICRSSSATWEVPLPQILLPPELMELKVRGSMRRSTQRPLQRRRGGKMERMRMW